VLSVTARGPSLREARDLAYAMVGRIGFPGGHFRRDIGARALGDATPPAAGRLTGAGGRG
jgi:phosphoribosylamine--glycine ligase